MPVCATCSPRSTQGCHLWLPACLEVDPFRCDRQTDDVTYHSWILEAFVAPPLPLLLPSSLAVARREGYRGGEQGLEGHEIHGGIVSFKQHRDTGRAVTGLLLPDLRVCVAGMTMELQPGKARGVEGLERNRLAAQ